MPPLSVLLHRYKVPPPTRRPITTKGPIVRTKLDPLIKILPWYLIPHQENQASLLSEAIKRTEKRVPLQRQPVLQIQDKSCYSGLCCVLPSFPRDAG